MYFAYGGAEIYKETKLCLSVFSESGWPGLIQVYSGKRFLLKFSKVFVNDLKEGR